VASIVLPLLEKVQIPTEFRDGIYFVSIKDRSRDKKEQLETKIKIYVLVTNVRDVWDNTLSLD
jgi:hypothetical protein